MCQRLQMVSWTCWKGVVGDTEQAWVGGISELLGEMIQVVQFVSLFSSPAESCLTFCNPMNCSMLGLPVHHQLLEFTQIMAIEWVMPSPYLILCNPFLLLPSIFPSIKVFSNESAFTSSGQSIGVSASISVLPLNTQDSSPLGWTSWISLQSKGLSRVFSNITVQKYQFSCAQLSL